MVRGAAVFLALVWLSFAPHARAQGAFEPPWLNGESRPEDLVVSLVTLGPGDQVHQYFGHIALEVRDRKSDVAALYNFGMFAFDKTFLLKFLKGRLEFWLGVQPTLLSYQFYADQDRDVRIMELELSPVQAANMARDLAVHALPENRTYLYHHYYDNCATRIVDAIDKATAGAFKRAAQGPARMSFRAHTRRYAARDPLMDWLLVFAMNDSMEVPIKRLNEMFLPEELERAVREFKYASGGKERRLAGREYVFHRAVVQREIYDAPPTTWPYTLGIGIAVGGLFAWLARYFHARRTRLSRVLYGSSTALFGFVFGVLGTVLAALALFTEHRVTYWNENLFFAHPLMLWLWLSGALLTFGVRRAERAVALGWSVLAGIATLGIVLKVLPNFDQDNVLVWTLLWPMTVGPALANFRARQSSLASVPARDGLATSGQ